MGEVKELETVSYELLCAEIDRLAERMFKHDETALYALQMVKCWAQEEVITPA